jgi:hypothetical protein
MSDSKLSASERIRISNATNTTRTKGAIKNRIKQTEGWLSVARTKLAGTRTRLELVDAALRKGPTLRSAASNIVTGELDRYLLSWVPFNNGILSKEQVLEERQRLFNNRSKELAYVTKLEGELKDLKGKTQGTGAGAAGSEGAGTPATKGRIWEKTITYNVSAVKEAYFTPGQSLQNKVTEDWSGIGATDRFDNELYAQNTPVKVTRAQELWKTAKGSKGMIQTWNPPGKIPPQYLDQNGNFATLSDAKSLKRYGFQFLYNPGTISMSYGGVPDVDPSMMSSGMEEFTLTNPSVFQSTINFEVLVNRMFDLKYINIDGTLKGSLKASDLWPQNSPDAATLKVIKDKGTMYDVEFLLQTMFSYEPIRSQFRGKTADIGFLGAFPVEMHLGNKLRYVVIIDRINVNHVIFDERMVPMFTTVSISARRVPDYKGNKIKKDS